MKIDYRLPIQDMIVTLLSELGPMTAPEIAVELKLEKNSVEAAIRKGYTKKPKRFYVHSFKRSFGTRGLWARKWDVGDLTDRPPPKMPHKETDARYRRGSRGILRLRNQARRSGVQSINHWLQILGATRMERAE